MLDDVNTTLLEQYIGSAKAFAAAGYVNGKWNNYPTLAAKYAKTLKLVSIDVANDPSAGAQCLDIESGDATIADAPNWFKATAAAGKKAGDLRYYPKLYTSESNLSSLVSTMTKAGIARDEYMLWSAHYTNEAHICGPSSCGSVVQADATQWTAFYQGVSLDASLCYGYFFESGPPVATPPAPAAKKTLATPQPKFTPQYKLEISWAAVPGAAAYQYQVEQSNGSAWVVVVADASTAQTSVVVPVGSRGDYRVRMACPATSSVQASPWGSWVAVTV